MKKHVALMALFLPLACIFTIGRLAIPISLIEINKSVINVLIFVESDHTIVKIKHNDTEAPLIVKNKIIQCFLTAMPAGEDMRLGRSLPYDIAVNKCNCSSPASKR